MTGVLLIFMTDQTRDTENYFHIWYSYIGGTANSTMFQWTESALMPVTWDQYSCDFINQSHHYYKHINTSYILQEMTLNNYINTLINNI